MLHETEPRCESLLCPSDLSIGHDPVIKPLRPRGVAKTVQKFSCDLSLRNLTPPSTPFLPLLIIPIPLMPSPRPTIPRTLPNLMSTPSTQQRSTNRPQTREYQITNRASAKSTKERIRRAPLLLLLMRPRPRPRSIARTVMIIRPCPRKVARHISRSRRVVVRPGTGDAPRSRRVLVGSCS
jgi:hypothetical protein